MIRTAFEKLIMEIQLNQKIKDILVLIMNTLGYSHEQMDELFKVKESTKKKGIFKMF